MQSAEGVCTVAVDSQLKDVLSFGNVSEAEACGRINHRAELVSVKADRYERTAITCNFKCFFRAVTFKSGFVCYVPAVEGHTLIDNIPIVQGFRHSRYFCSRADESNAEIAEYKHAFKLGCVAEAIIYFKCISALSYRGKGDFGEGVLVDIIPDGDFFDFFSVEDDVIRKFKTFERKLRTDIVNVAFKFIEKCELFLRIFINRVYPRLLHLAAAPADTELVSYGDVCIKNIFFPLCFAPVQTVRRLVEEENVRLFKGETGFSGEKFLF